MVNGKRRESVTTIVTRLETQFNLCILGVEGGDPGLINRVKSIEANLVDLNHFIKDGPLPTPDHLRIMKDLYGNKDSVEPNEMKGLIVRFDDHATSHKRLTAAIIAVLGPTAAACLAMWRDILQGLGLLKS